MRIIVVGGPTREYIDPVRFISNASTGEFALQIAARAKKKGHSVVCVLGPINLPKPKGIKCQEVESAESMMRAIKKYYKSADCVVMAAAVCDFRPKKMSKEKIKKKNLWMPVFEKNIDIAAELTSWPGKKIRVGFALESNDLLANAKRKLKEKKFDFIIANKITRQQSPFGRGRKNFYLIKKKGYTENYTDKNKSEMATIIIDNIERLW